PFEPSADPQLPRRGRGPSGSYADRVAADSAGAIPGGIGGDDEDDARSGAAAASAAAAARAAAAAAGAATPAPPVTAAPGSAAPARRPARVPPGRWGRGGAPARPAAATAVPTPRAGGDARRPNEQAGAPGVAGPPAYHAGTGVGARPAARGLPDDPVPSPQ